MSEAKEFNKRFAPTDLYKDPFNSLANLGNTIDSREFSQLLGSPECQREHSATLEDIEIRHSNISIKIKGPKKNLFPELLEVDELKATLNETTNRGTEYEVGWVFTMSLYTEEVDYFIHGDKASAAIRIIKDDEPAEFYRLHPKYCIDLLLGIVSSIGYNERDYVAEFRQETEGLSIEETIIRILDAMSGFEGNYQLRIKTPVIPINADTGFMAVAASEDTVSSSAKSVSLHVAQASGKGDIVDYEYLKIKYDGVRIEENSEAFAVVESDTHLATVQCVKGGIATMDYDLVFGHDASGIQTPIEVVDCYDNPDKWEHIISVVDTFSKAALQQRAQEKSD